MDPAQQNGNGDDLVTQLKQMTELAARAQADLQNARTRMQRDAEDIRKYASADMLIKLLPTVDNFQRAFKHLPADLQNHEWIKGIVAVEQELIRHLGEMGLKKMEVLGTQVDTAKHEVVTVAPGKEGEIVEVVEDGYELHGKVLRPAKVIVGAGT